MQAIKDKIHDMTSMRKAKADAKAEEKAEKELAKAKMEVAHEVRLAREAEATMDMHVAKADEVARQEISKHSHSNNPTTYSAAGPRQENKVGDLNEYPRQVTN